MCNYGISVLFGLVIRKENVWVLVFLKHIWKLMIVSLVKNNSQKKKASPVFKIVCESKEITLNVLVSSVVCL